MERRSSPDDVDTHLPSQAGHPCLPSRITLDDVDTRWPYRAGYPRLLRPSVVSIPIEGTEKPISDLNFEQLRLRILDILKSYDIPWSGSLTPLPEVVYRRQKFGTSGLTRVLIPCDYDKDISYSKKWTKAVVEIYAETQSVVDGDRGVGVELVDTVSMNSRICTLPIHMSQELSENWENGRNYCKQILQLFEAPHEMFQAMIPIGRCTMRPTGAFNDGDPAYETTAVILFDALNAEDESWDSFEERIRSILPRHIGIEIRQRSGPLFSSPPVFLDKDADGYIPSPEDYARPPRPGCDIGAKGSRSAGTLGGYVVTEDENGKRTAYGVTNAHVALQSYEKRSFSASAESGIRMVSPSDISRVKAQYGLLKMITNYETWIKADKRIIDAWEEKDPELSQRKRKRVKKYESLLASLKSNLKLNEQDPYIGSVQHARLGNIDSSTLLSQSEVMMDLALLKMDCLGSERPQEIYLKEKLSLPAIEPDTTCDFWETDGLGVSHDGDGKDHIKVVGKLSRSGTYRFGIVNDFRAVTFPFTENGVKNDGKFYVWAVSYPASITMEPFSVPGDSGSFVIAAEGWKYYDFDNRVAVPSPQAQAKTRSESRQVFVVGLQFASTQYSELSYFVPFDEVKSQIESLTGGKLVWPRKHTDFLSDDVA